MLITHDKQKSWNLGSERQLIKNLENDLKTANDKIDGGSGIDTIDYSDLSSGIKVTLLNDSSFVAPDKQAMGTRA